MRISDLNMMKSYRSRVGHGGYANERQSDCYDDGGAAAVDGHLLVTRDDYCLLYIIIADDEIL